MTTASLCLNCARRPALKTIGAIIVLLLAVAAPAQAQPKNYQGGHGAPFVQYALPHVAVDLVIVDMGPVCLFLAQRWKHDGWMKAIPKRDLSPGVSCTASVALNRKGTGLPYVQFKLGYDDDLYVVDAGHVCVFLEEGWQKNLAVDIAPKRNLASGNCWGEDLALIAQDGR